MAGKAWTRLRPLLLWQYRRGSWQYDVIVALILAFIFLSPRFLFNDRPSVDVVHEVDAPAEGSRLFWIEPGALKGASAESAIPRLEELLRERSGEALTVVRTEAARDDAGNLRAYLVYAQP